MKCLLIDILGRLGKLYRWASVPVRLWWHFKTGHWAMRRLGVDSYARHYPKAWARVEARAAKRRQCNLPPLYGTQR